MNETTIKTARRAINRLALAGSDIRWSEEDLASYRRAFESDPTAADLAAILDRLARGLESTDHCWSPADRDAYEGAVRSLGGTPRTAHADVKREAGCDRYYFRSPAGPGLER